MTYKNTEGEKRINMNILFILIPKSSVAYIYDRNTIRQGLEKMRNRGYTEIPVISEKGEYMGTVSEGDFLWHMLDQKVNTMKDGERYHIADILKKDRNTPVHISATMEDVLEKIVVQNFIPVIDERNCFIGIITRKDVIKHFFNMKAPQNPEPGQP